MAEPQYFIEVIDDQGNNENWYGWIGETGGRSVWMRTEDTHTIYTAPEEIDDAWREVIKSYMLLSMLPFTPC